MGAMTGFGVGLVVLLFIAFVPGRSFDQGQSEDRGATPGERQTEN